MQAAAIIDLLIEKHILISHKDGKLSVEAPKGAVTAELADMLRANKSALIDYLQQRDKVQAAQTEINIKPVARQAESYLPLSFSQQRLCFIDQLEGASPQYNIPSAIEINGALNVEAFKRTIGRIIERHEVIRTHFTDIDGQLCPVVLDEYDLPIEIIDLTNLQGQEQGQKVQALVREDAMKVFALDQDIFLRVVLLVLNQSEGNEKHVVLFNMHHVASDGWSRGILINEFCALYNAFNAHKDDPLPELAIQYGDYAHWQRNWLQGEVLKQQLDYWKEQLSGCPQTHGLPLDKPRTAHRSAEGYAFHQDIDSAIYKKMSTLCKASDVTLYMFMQSAFSLLLSRYSNETDIVIGTATAGRVHRDIEPLIGFFVNDLVLRFNVSPLASFNQLLEDNKQVILQAYAYQHIPFEMLVETLNPERSLNYQPLYQIKLDMIKAGKSDLSLDGLELHHVPQQQQINKYELHLSVTERENGLSIDWHYSKDLFYQDTIKSMAENFAVLLQSIVDAPQKPVSQLNLLSQSSRDLVLNQFNQTDAAFADSACIHEVFELRSIAEPDKIAVRFDQQQISLSQLNEQANQLARFLISNGIKPNDTVAVCVERSIELYVSILAVLKAGGTFVPIDPTLPEDRIEHMLEDSGVEIVLTQSELMAEMMFEEYTVIPIDGKMSAALFGHLEKGNIDKQSLGLTSTDTAYIIYTSGSTGQPKGVAVKHQGIVNLCDWQYRYFKCDRNTVVGQLASLAFDASVWESMMALTNGLQMVMLNRHAPSDELSETIKQTGVNVLVVVPSVLKLFKPEQLVGCDLTIMSVGEKLSPELAELWKDKLRLLNGYGPTEASIHTHTFAVSDVTDVTTIEHNIPIGQPIDNSKTYIVDEHQQLLPIGVIGEICVSGVGIAKGYLNRQDLTQSQFVTNPFVSAPNHAVMYKTGDIGRWLANGCVELLGRVDNQVKIRGQRIELGEIESRLLLQNDVLDVVVAVRQNERDESILVAYLVMNVSDEAPLEDVDKAEIVANIRSNLKAALPDYMVPSAFVFVDSLPLNPSGKIDLQHLPHPQEADFHKSHYVEPQTEVEQHLCTVWQEELGMEQVGIDDDFFNIGGDSIRSLSVISQAKKYGYHLSVKDIFTCRTVRQLAQFIEHQPLPPSKAITASDFSLLTEQEMKSLTELIDNDVIEDAYPLSNIQQGMVVLNLLNTDKGFYHDVTCMRLKVQWHSETFITALEHLVKRHTIFRSVFWLDGERPLQLIYKDIQLPFTVHDIRQLDEHEQNKTIEQWSEQELVKPFDFSVAPWKIEVHLIADDVISFNLSLHHALLDGWSVASFNTELFGCYKSLLETGKLPQIAEGAIEPLPYRQFVAEELAAMHCPEQQRYWLEKLEEANVPWWSGHDRGMVIGTNHLLGEARSKALNELAKSLNVQDKTLMLSIHMVLMSMLTGSDDVTTSVVANGRPLQEGSEKTLGVFLNSLPFRLKDIHGNWAEFIQQVDSSLGEMSAHLQYPLNEVQKHTGKDFSASLFNYTNFHVYQQVEDVELLGTTATDNNNFQLKFGYAKNSATNQYRIRIESDTFELEQLQKFCGYLDKIIDHLLNSQHEDICLQQYIGQHELDRLLNQFNDTKVDYRDDILIHQLFDEQAKQHPNAQAVVFEGQSLSYGQLDARTTELALYLQSVGVTGGSLVGLAMERSLEMVISMLAIFKSGGVYVPLEPTYPVGRLNDIIQDSALALVLCQSRFTQVFEQLPVTTVDVDTLDEALLGFNNQKLTATPQGSDSLAYVIFTSGSTGRPKGVQIEHRSIVNRIEAMQNDYQLRHDDRVLQKTPFSFDISVWEFLWPLSYGGTLVMSKPMGHTDPLYLNRLVEEQQISHLHFVPSMLDAFLTIGETQLGQQVRCIYCSGEALTIGIVKKLAQRAPHVKLHNLYGPTEATIEVSSFDCSQLDLAVDQIVPIGKPLQNVQLYVLDKHGNCCPQGGPGELHIGGVCVARGYISRDDLTAQQFIDNPFGSGRLYKTGDLVRQQSDGNIVYLGRMDHQVKIRGFRIELAEIENSLNALPQVQSSLVLAQQATNGDKMLMAYVNLDSSQQQVPNTLMSDTLKNQLGGSLPTYMIPGVIVFIEQWPLTVNGKLDRTALPQLSDIIEQNQYIAPSTEVEQQLVDIWAHVLELSPKSLSTTANFFELGGNSLNIFSIVSLAKEQNLEFAIGDIWQYPTIGALAKHLNVDGA